MSILSYSLAIASAALCALAEPALAHAHLKSATPPIDGTVSGAPTELDLTFSEGVNLKFTGVTVTGPGKAAIATGAVKSAAGGDMAIVVPLTAPLAPGRYTINWHALATDGHKTNGSYGITVTP